MDHQQLADGFIYGYKQKKVWTIIAWLLVFLSFGSLALVFYWKPIWLLKLTHKKSKLKRANRILHIDFHNQKQIHSIVEQYVTNKSDSIHKIPLNDSVFQLLSLRNSKWINKGMEENTYGNPKGMNCIRYFIRCYIKFIWNEELNLFEEMDSIKRELNSHIVNSHPLNQTEVENLRYLYGKNTIRFPLTPIPIILLREVLNPFNIFQLFSIIIFYIDYYAIYATALLILSIVSLTWITYERKKAEKDLNERMHIFHDANVVRWDKQVAEIIDAEDLVPGDIIEVPPQGGPLSCDLLLLTGRCIVDEGVLTGESSPQIKVAQKPIIKNDSFDIQDNRFQILFSGTTICQAFHPVDNEPVRAVVIRTGFATARGEMLRSLLFPKPIDFEFTRDVIRFVILFTLMGAIACMFTIFMLTKANLSTKHVLLRSLDMLLILVPPALPIIMMTGTYFAQDRLKKKQIICTNLLSINLAGAINVVCFDKTGTLTESDLRIHSVHNNQQATNVEANISESSSELEYAMGVCHSLDLLGYQVIGDHIDQHLYTNTQWRFAEIEYAFNLQLTNKRILTHEKLQHHCVIAQQYPFVSEKRSMSVLSIFYESIQQKENGGEIKYLVKGAPEVILDMCKQDSFSNETRDLIKRYSSTGYRVIAFAEKLIDNEQGSNVDNQWIRNFNRENYENEMNFLGFVVFHNELKEESFYTVTCLHSANIRTLLVTGDNILTGISVARRLKMINSRSDCLIVGQDENHDEWQSDNNVASLPEICEQQNVSVKINSKANLCISGDVWNNIKGQRPDMYDDLIKHGVVFARFSPMQKMELICALKEAKNFVCMVGDGANDCAALRAAHAGLALNSNEACVAGSFTATNMSISSTLELLKEGRCALETAYVLFKFMGYYALIQFATVAVLIKMNSVLNNWQYLYIDIFLVPVLSFAMAHSKAAPILFPRTNFLRLSTIRNISELLLQILIIVIFLIFQVIVLYDEDWFFPMINPIDKQGQFIELRYENTALFFASLFQYIIIAFCINSGLPFREPLFKNYYFWGCASVVTILSTILMFIPGGSFKQFFQLLEPPIESLWGFKAKQLGLILAHSFVALLISMMFFIFYDLKDRRKK